PISVVVGASARVVPPGTGDQVQEAAGGRTEDAHRRETLARNDGDGGHSEGELVAGGVRNVDAVPGVQPVQVPEEGCAKHAIEVASHYSLAGGAGTHARAQPTCIPDVGRHVHAFIRPNADALY